MRILVVEDEARMATLLQQGLAEEGHFVHVANDGREGLETALSTAFDVIVLDVLLPRMDGFSVVKRLRQASNNTPILMLTARDRMADVVTGLDAGADDYLTKPFAFEILLARLRAMGRRGPIPQSVFLKCADLCMDTTTRRVTRNGQSVNLTPTEYSLLEVLLRNAGRPVSRSVMLQSVWGFDTEVEDNTVEAFVRLLRNKVDVPFDSKLIHTVRGFGYCLQIADRE
ncbi:MAG TPA: response regulator transcription factor [Bryobacteraceae bacterium]|jgi:DNA-binding response OmpR family regulator